MDIDEEINITVGYLAHENSRFKTNKEVKLTQFINKDTWLHKLEKRGLIQTFSTSQCISDLFDSDKIKNHV